MFKKIIMIIFVLSISGQVNASENFYWLVNKLWKVDPSEKTKAIAILQNVSKGETIIIPVVWAGALCDFNKSVITYTNGLKNTDASCLYNGSVKNLKK